MNTLQPDRYLNIKYLSDDSLIMLGNLVARDYNRVCTIERKSLVESDFHEAEESLRLFYFLIDEALFNRGYREALTPPIPGHPHPTSTRIQMSADQVRAMFEAIDAARHPR